MDVFHFDIEFIEALFEFLRLAFQLIDPSVLHTQNHIVSVTLVLNAIDFIGGCLSLLLFYTFPP